MVAVDPHSNSPAESIDFHAVHHTTVSDSHRRSLSDEPRVEEGNPS